MMRNPERSFARLESDIHALRHAVEALRIAGVEILSAEISSFADSPMIHVADHPTVRAIPGRYTRARIANSDIYAVSYMACQLTWLDPSPFAGRMAEFPELERTAEHGHQKQNQA